MPRKVRKTTSAKGPVEKMEHKPPVSFTPARKEIFLVHYREHGNKSKAAAVAGVRPSTVASHCNPERAQYDPVFAQEVADAYTEYVDDVEEEIKRRAIDGVTKDVYGRVGKHRDGVVGQEKVYSDNLLGMMARRHIKEYRQKDVNVKGSISHNHEHRVTLENLTPKQRALLRQMVEEQKALPAPQPDVVDAEYEDVT